MRGGVIMCVRTMLHAPASITTFTINRTSSLTETKRYSTLEKQSGA